MTIVNFTGDIFETNAPVIGHGVNIRANMAGGIARTIRGLYPSVFRAYRAKCEAGELLGGECLLAKADEWDGDEPRYIANISSQIEPGADARLDLLHAGLLETLQIMSYAGLSVLALPHIGAGIGGLDLEDVLSTIHEVSEKFPEITIEIWTFKPAV